MAISALGAQALKLAAKLAKNEDVRKGAITAALWAAGKTGTSAIDQASENVQVRQGKRAAAKAKREAEQENRALALELARQQKGAQYSEGIVVDGVRRHIVWREGKPIACFPALDGNPTLAELAERPELAGLEDFLIRNPPPSTDNSE